MADRWAIVQEQEEQFAVYRNASWYTDAEDLDEALGVVRNQRATTVRITEMDGHVETRSL